MAAGRRTKCPGVEAAISAGRAVAVGGAKPGCGVADALSALPTRANGTTHLPVMMRERHHGQNVDSEVGSQESRTLREHRTASLASVRPGRAASRQTSLGTGCILTLDALE